MIRRQLMYVSVSLLLLALVISTVLPTIVSAATFEPYPAMLPGKSVGSITGRVTNTNGTGIAGANVTIVNASNLSILYSSCKADSSGNFGFSGVNSSSGLEAYRVYANSTGYSDAYSIPVLVEPGNTCNVHTLILGGNGPSPTPTPSPTPKPGNVSGYVTMAGYGGAISDATVTLVDAQDAFTIFSTAHTDYYGHYRFEGVKATGAPGYRIHVEKAGFVEVYSSPFTVNQETAIKVNMTLSKTPVVTPANNSAGNVSGTGGNSTVVISAQPSATSPAKSGLPGLPGFEAVAALAGIAVAYAAARKH